MSVLCADAVAMLSPDARCAYDVGDLADVVYADDTLIIAVASKHLEAVAQSGKAYGMAPLDTFQFLPIQCTTTVRTPDCNSIPCKTRMQYLGTTLSEDVRDKHEILKRMAMARKDFIALSNVWRRSALTWKRKLAIYDAIIESKLLYGLSSICLTVTQERQLNGFQNRCVRTIIGVKPSYISRVSNDDVLSKAGQASATQTLRTATFIPGTNRPLTDRYVRKRGRPYKDWLRTWWPAYCREFDKDGDGVPRSFHSS